MAFLITDSATPLLMETVPALKLTHFYGTPARDNVYAYVRCYLHKGTLHLSATAFDEAPPAHVRFYVCLGRAENPAQQLVLSLAPSGDTTLALHTADDTARPLHTATVPVVTGGDEQGLYWSVQTTIDAAAFRKAFGQTPKAGSVLTGNVFLASTEESAFGSASPVPLPCTPPYATAMDTWMVVPY